MKQKIFLPLLEQIIMIGFFAIVAVICLRGFALSNRISNDQAVQDHAVIAAQNTAETLKSTRGDLHLAATVLSGQVGATVLSGQEVKVDTLIVFYDSNGEPTLDAEAEVFRVRATLRETTDVYLGSAVVEVLYHDEIIYTLTVGWQNEVEVAHENT